MGVKTKDRPHQHMSWSRVESDGSGVFLTLKVISPDEARKAALPFPIELPLVTQQLGQAMRLEKQVL